MSIIDGVEVVKGESNGLTQALIGFEDEDLEDLYEIFDETELQIKTQEEVAQEFADFVDSLSPADKPLIKDKMKKLASFIYINGIHEALRDNNKTADNETWKDLKTYFDFKASRKQTILRWVMPLLYALNAEPKTRPKNISYRHAAKFGLEADLLKISTEFRFFGSYFHPDASVVDRAAARNFQKRVITMSQGGVAANAVNA